jgi:hypothetical protein
MGRKSWIGAARLRYSWFSTKSPIEAREIRKARDLLLKTEYKFRDEGIWISEQATRRRPNSREQERAEFTE